MTKTFDLLVLGAGSAGIAAANKCAVAGWSVGIVDELPYGGTCALRGCDPKKMLRRGAEIIDAADLMTGKGINKGSLSINWSELMAHKRAFTSAMPGRVEAGLKRNGVELFHAPAGFVNESTVEIEGRGAVTARHFLIATGATPRPLSFAGAEYVIDSTAFLELEALPPRLLFLGGGFVSFEFAHIAARAGAEVTILHHSERMLKQFDPDLVAMLVKRTRRIGIKIVTNVEPVSLEKDASGLTLVAKGVGGNQQFSADAVVHGAGRVPAISDLNLHSAGIKSSDAGIVIHPHLQSVSNRAVYAAGDVAATPGQPLTPVAVFEAKVAASNMLKGTTNAPDHTGVPSAVFTVPELVRVGLLEEEAMAQGLDFSVRFTDTSGWYSNLRVGEIEAAAKVLIDNPTGKILGAHLFGPEYGELINFFGLAMRLGLKANDLKKMVAAYPSVGSDLGSLV
ncbi:MAG: NAD(P)/FAD-dependent oxidoreductase [Alphaproteobacteria bacterium]|nr:NAD(P)/FAD-dependent oxidoreductase [Alphaproteobacteria bacterium]